jgi:hypothetical protein
MCVLQWLAWNHALKRAREQPDPTVVWMPKPADNPLAALLGGAAAAPTATPGESTTRGAVEADRAEKQMSTAQMLPLMILGMSFLGGIHMPCVLQTIMIPLSLLEDPQLRRVLLGVEPGAGVALYGEVFADPALLPVATGGGTVVAAGHTATAGGNGPAAAPSNPALVMEEAVYQCWETGATEGVPVDSLLQLNESSATASEVGVADVGQPAVVPWPQSPPPPSPSPRLAIAARPPVALPDAGRRVDGADGGVRQPSHSPRRAGSLDGGGGGGVWRGGAVPA